MATSHGGASDTSSRQQSGPSDLNRFTSSSATATGLQALEHAEHSLTDLQQIMSDIRNALLSSSGSAGQGLDHPHFQAHRELRARQKRNSRFGGSLFSDPAWEILLQLYAELPKRKSMGVKELALWTGIAMSTMLRWIATLETKGLIWRRGNEDDRRAVDVGLTERGNELMRSHFAE